MKKIISLLLVVGLICGLSVKAFADVASADALYGAGKYAEAEVQYKAVLPSLTAEIAGSVQYAIAHCEFQQGNLAKALPEFQKVLLVDKAMPTTKSNAQMHIGLIMAFTNKDSKEATRFDDGIAELRKVALIKDGDPTAVAYSQFMIGELLNTAGRTDEAQAEYLKVCNKNGGAVTFYSAMSKIDVNIVGIDAYITYLKKLLVATPSIAENAEFLGQIKSEIEKLK